MDSLLFTATSGASRVLKAQHVRSNNLSNADTAGSVRIWNVFVAWSYKARALMAEPWWSQTLHQRVLILATL